MSEPAAPADLPVACSLSEADLARREQEIAEEIFAGVRGVEELADGYAFEFSASSTEIDTLIEFIRFERQCCPFFTFELVFLPAQGPIWLRLRGPEGVKGVIEQMLPAGRHDHEGQEG